MGIELNGVLPAATRAIEGRAEEAASRTEITKAEKVGYSVAPITQSAIDLIQGDSLQEVGDKFVLTAKTHVDIAKQTVKNTFQGLPDVIKDSNDGPLKGWFSK